ncbi:hypothetical protein BSZ19_18415 [Bradyrhizobium japonicum]|uniref:Uncharacterized protein n=1 Tax=Bradyrhizobium japonicum TaxID=375 RepID=A0A1Y2JQ91_BRAJP|nr:hypothetical protein BSZ19_18415 [Bradyrhizobium japonicum]
MPARWLLRNVFSDHYAAELAKAVTEGPVLPMHYGGARPHANVAAATADRDCMREGDWRYD